MAQRKEARIFVTIWDDPAFRAHTPSAQRMYMYLLSQADLSYCGVIPLRERRWARDAHGLTVKDVLTDLEALSEPFPEPFREGLPEGCSRPLLVVDDDTGEVLIRSLIRNDRIWKIPNLLKSARESATVIRSARIKAALVEELRRLPLNESPSAQVNAIVKSFIADLRAGLPDPPPNPSAKGSVNPSEKGSGYPPADPSQGIGVPVGDTEFPCPQEPPPPARAHASETADTSTTAGAQAEGEETLEDLDLIRQVRELRPDWATGSITRALRHPAVLERPAALRGPALIAVARDPASQQPGRLAHDGPWWITAAQPAQPGRPTWCGLCDEQTRLIGVDTPRRCPNCHPLRDEETA